MIYGVAQIALPNSDWGGAVRGDGPRSSVAPSATSTATGESPRSEVFVVGPENRLVIPALERLLAEEHVSAGKDLSAATELFNPLVLLGPTGTGKSHLARGMTRRWQARLGESAVEYMTAIDFARQLRDSRDDGRLECYRERLAGLQLLILEDLQRLPPSLFVQRELRDTLDLLIESGAVTVITAQQPPAAMAGLEAGLRDRLASGLTVRLQLPGVEARWALLKLTAKARGYQISDQQLRQLAQKVEGTAPQVVRAIAEYELTTQLSTRVGKRAAEVSVRSAAAKRAALLTTSSTTDLGATTADVRPPLKLKHIIAVVARYFSLSQAALCSSARRKSLVYARGTAIYLARALTDVSYAQIGQALGRRDHSTVIHAARSIEKKIVSEAGTQQDIEELKRILTAV